MVIYNREEKVVIIPEGNGSVGGRRNPCEKAIEEAFQDGYESGTTDGFATGYSSGTTDGYQEGYDAGIIAECGEAIEQAFDEGFNSGHTSGFTDGYSSGWTDGYSSGWTDGWTSAKTQSLIIRIKTASVIGAYQLITNIKLNGESVSFYYNTAVMRTISIYGDTAESAVTSISFTMAAYTELVDGIAINGIYYDAESVTIEDLGGGLYNYTIAFDEVPIYEENSYKAGIDQGYISGTNRQANIQLDFDIVYGHQIRCRQLKVNDEYMRVEYYADDATIIGYTNITPITKIEMEITGAFWGPGILNPPSPIINGMTINGLPATIESQSSEYMDYDGGWTWYKYTFNISSFVFTEYNEGYQAGLAACQNNENQ